MQPIPTIDAHHHIWRLKDLTWLSGPQVPRIFGPYESIRRDYTIEEFRADTAGCSVVKSVYVQTNWPSEQSYDEARWLQSVADATGWPHANVAYADLADPDCATLIERLAQLPATRGIRQQIHWHVNPQYRFAPHPEVMNDPQWRRGLAYLAEHNLLFEIQLFTSQMHHGAALARTFPDVVFVLEHAGMLEDMSGTGWKLWRDGMQALAAEPNMNVKLSGLGTFVRACRAGGVPGDDHGALCRVDRHNSGRRLSDRRDGTAGAEARGGGRDSCLADEAHALPGLCAGTYYERCGESTAGR